MHYKETKFLKYLLSNLAKERLVTALGNLRELLNNFLDRIPRLGYNAKTQYKEIQESEYYNLKNKSGRFLVIRPNKSRAWYENGNLHRTDGPAIIWKCGSSFWYQNGKPHREDGPAVIYLEGTDGWFLNGKLHRTDGPAVYLENGGGMYYLNGSFFDKEEWFKQLTPEELAVALANPENF